MKLRIDEVGEILDEHIVKAIARSRKRPTIADYEAMVVKNLTHNPFSPEEISGSEGSPHYTPYLSSVDGGFYPHPLEYWTQQGKDPSTYRETHSFYEKLGIAQQSIDNLQALQQQGNKFSFLARSVLREEKIEEEIFIDLKKADRLLQIGDIGKLFIIDRNMGYFIVENEIPMIWVDK